jgi:hypothetical protein
VKAKAPHDGSRGSFNRNMLKFQDGAVITLLSKDDPNWWEVSAGQTRFMDSLALKGFTWLNGRVKIHNAASP